MTTDSVTSRTCIGPFPDTDRGMDLKYLNLMKQGTAVLIPVNQFNPFKRFTIKMKYDQVFHTTMRFGQIWVDKGAWHAEVA
jgi:hypothetical protein